MAPRDSRGVLFDIDGTLVDTNYLHTVAWLRAFSDCGGPQPAASIHRLIGMGGGRLVETLVGRPRDDVKARWRHHFDLMKGEITALPGAAALLRAVAGRGAVVVLASSSEEADVEALLAAIDAPDAISAVTSSGDVDAAKPEPDVFGVAMEKAGLDPSRTIVVGDTVWDVEAARRCGLDCVCVRTGGISAAELTEAGAVAVYESPAALLDSLDTNRLGSHLA